MRTLRGKWERRLGLLPLALTVGMSMPLAAAVAVGAAPPGKSSSPPTNLLAYPKLPVPATPPQATGSAASGVSTVTVNADGTRSVTQYDAAPGVSDAQLLQELQAAGAVGTTGSSVSPLVSSTACSWGTARTIQCPPAHWANNGHAHPQVYFVDHTGSAWPVDQATYTWNQAQGIDSLYTWGSCPGYGGTHCVNVNDANYGATGWVGLTTYQLGSNNNFVDGKVFVRLNDYPYGVNAAGHRQAACHEQGHALGMGHNTSTSSCLYFQITNATGSQRPNNDDFSLIAGVYSVAH